MSIVTFTGSSEEPLSSYYPCSFYILGRHWHNSEQCYLSFKYKKDTPSYSTVLETKDPHVLAKLANKLESGRSPTSWGNVKVTAMWIAQYGKYLHGRHLRELLLGTGQAEILYESTNPWWGIGKDGNGANRLGLILTKVREVMATYSEATIEHLIFATRRRAIIQEYGEYEPLLYGFDDC